MTTTQSIDLLAGQTLSIRIGSKVDDAQVLTDVPAGALFTDTDTVYRPDLACYDGLLP